MKNRLPENIDDIEALMKAEMSSGEMQPDDIVWNRINESLEVTPVITNKTSFDRSVPSSPFLSYPVLYSILAISIMLNVFLGIHYLSTGEQVELSKDVIVNEPLQDVNKTEKQIPASNEIIIKQESKEESIVPNKEITDEALIAIKPNSNNQDNLKEDYEDAAVLKENEVDVINTDSQDKKESKKETIIIEESLHNPEKKKGIFEETDSAKIYKSVYERLKEKKSTKREIFE